MIGVETLNTIVANGAILLQLGVLGILFLLWKGKGTAFSSFVKRYGLWAAFLVALLGTGLSLYYSEVLGILPCGLCWLQRVFLYPLVPILGLAAWRGDTRIIPYVILLSVLGAAVALYHHALQIGVTEALPCPAVSGAADCTKRYIFEYGYITFPFIAFASFAFIGVLSYFVGKNRE